ncbi:MAG: hypothetical protein LBF16_05840 [Pseudomonadales bacterium]|jgi:hypothetical protein|nr:hypothetical protein [Pseudomonadales bacterium]
MIFSAIDAAMYIENELPSLLTSLQNNLKLLATLIAKFDQRESLMRPNFDKSIYLLHDEVTELHRRVDSIVSTANTRITEEAKAAMVPATAKYDQAVSAVSKQLHGVSKTVWT